MGLSLKKIVRSVTKPVEKLVKGTKDYLGPIGGILGNALGGTAGGAAGAAAGTLLSGGSLSGGQIGSLLSGVGSLFNLGGSDSWLGKIGSFFTGAGNWMGENASSFGTQTLADSIFSLDQAKELAGYNAKQQLMLNNQAYANDIDMWNKQNAYNTPLAQMQRYADAGLNPNLIYGNGTSSAGNASGAPSYNPVNYHGADINSIMAFQQLENLNAQNKLLDAQATAAKLQAVGMDYDNKIKAVNLGFAPALKEAELQATRLENTRGAAINKLYTRGADVLDNLESGNLPVVGNSLWDKLGSLMYRYSKSAHDNEYLRRRVYKKVYGTLDNYRR